MNFVDEGLQFIFFSNEQGNLLFKNKNYEEAIEKYTVAISKNEDLVRAYSNRAQCNLNLVRKKF
jgi:tetratricopeptide (TPR) repeat protein